MPTTTTTTSTSNATNLTTVDGVVSTLMPIVFDLVQDHRQKSDWSDVNTTTTGDEVLPIDMVFNDGHRLSIIVYSILMVVSTVGNVTVLKFLIARRRASPSRVDVMLMHLAMADLMVTLVLMPLEIGWAWTVSWTAGNFMCHMMAFFRTFGLYLSSFVLVCISLDRYYAVLYPMHLAGIDRRSRVMLAVAYVFSMLCSVPQALIFHVETHPKVTYYEQCVTFHVFENENHILTYSMAGLVMMYVLPLVVIVFCYVSIYKELYRRSRTMEMGDRFRRSNDDVLSRAKKKTLWMTITIVIVFIVCWTPYNVICFWYWLDKDAALKLDQRLQKLLFLFACTNSCMNPIVYGLFNIPRRTGGGGGAGKNVGDSSGRMTHMSLRTMSNKHRIIERRRESLNSTQTNASVRRYVCRSCGEVIEQPNLKKHNLYH